MKPSDLNYKEKEGEILTTEEKLQHFYDASIESAAKEAATITKEHQDALDKTFLEHKETKERQAMAQIKTETDRIKREINKVVSARQIETRRIISAKKDELEAVIFEDIEKRLEIFKKSPEYIEYLTKHIQEAIDFAQKDEMVVYIDPSDEACIPELEKRFGFAPKISRESWMGGMRAVIRSKNILIDNSFATLLQDAKDEFVFSGGRGDE